MSKYINIKTILVTAVISLTISGYAIAQVINQSPTPKAYYCPFNTLGLDSVHINPDNVPITFQWSLVSGTNPDVKFTSPDTLLTEFCVKDNGTWTVRLTVSDGIDITFDDTILKLNE